MDIPGTACPFESATSNAPMVPSNPKIRRADALPAMVGVLILSAMIVMACEGFVRCEATTGLETPAIAEVFFLVQPFQWPMFLACLLWGTWLLASPEVRLRDAFLHVGITGNLANLWLVWGLVCLFTRYHDTIGRLINAPVF